MKNRFITVEGLDGSGKTTIISKIVKYLNNRGIINIITTYEPGGTPIAESLRLLIKYGVQNESMNNISELLMIYAARAQLLENIIKPALYKGYWVIGDRYDLSSHAYQGGGRGIDQSLLNILSQYVTDDLSPDLVLYLDIPPETVFCRIKNRKKLDRIEQESLSFFNRVRTYYHQAINFKKNIILINANQNLEKVSISVYKYLDALLFYS